MSQGKRRLGSQGSQTLDVKHFHNTVVLRLSCTQGRRNANGRKQQLALASLLGVHAAAGKVWRGNKGEEQRRSPPVCCLCIFGCASLTSHILHCHFLSTPENDLNKCSLFKVYLRKGQGGCQGSFPIVRSLVEWLCRKEAVRDRSEPYAVVGSVDTRVGRSDTPWHTNWGFPVQV